MSPEKIALIQVDQKEIIDFAFFPSEEVEAKASAMLGKRILQCIEALHTGQIIYLEDQQLPDF